MAQRHAATSQYTPHPTALAVRCSASSERHPSHTGCTSVEHAESDRQGNSIAVLSQQVTCMHGWHRAPDDSATDRHSSTSSYELHPPSCTGMTQANASIDATAASSTRQNVSAHRLLKLTGRQCLHATAACLASACVAQRDLSHSTPLCPWHHFQLWLQAAAAGAPVRLA